MMKRLITTILNKDISKYTMQTILDYSSKVSAVFIPIKDKKEIYKLLNKYDKVIYFNYDVIVREDTPDLFEITPDDKLSMFNEGKYYGVEKYDEDIMVIPKNKKDFILGDIDLKDEDVNELSYEYNRTHKTDIFVGRSRLHSYIIHYKGAPDDILVDVIKKDLKEWENKNYYHDRNFLINVSAGMGDQICSIPAIRYTKDMYPDDKFYILTHFPELFKQFEDERTYVGSYDTWKGIEDPLIKLPTCPDENETTHNLSHVMFHPTDFASMSMIKKNIPNKDKQITLPNEKVETMKEWIGEIDKPLILVHAGKWWASKTFPIGWWQELVDKLSVDYTIGLIGKTIDDKQGYLNIIPPRGSIDFRDRTSLKELLSLISIAPILVTNDSSPIHIAGAFDNWIVTFPTCKHEEHILPFRNGKQDYKTLTMYKKLLLDDLETRHTELIIDTIDNVPVGKRLFDYLPEIDDVVKNIKDLK